MPKSRDSKKAVSEINPFRVRKTKVDEERKGEADTLSPPDEIADAIDAFRMNQEQARHFEGEATVHKNTILEYAQAEYAKRAFAGKTKSFKILGREGLVTYIVVDSSGGLTDDDLAEIKERWGANAADALVVPDYGSIKFNTEVLEANYEKVIEALRSLPADILENLFRPMVMKAKKRVVDTAKKYTKNPAQMGELLRQLKVIHYIK